MQHEYVTTRWVFLAVLVILLAPGCNSYKPTAPTPKPTKFAASLPDGSVIVPHAIVRWLDVSTPLQVGALLAETHHMDAVFIPDGGAPGACTPPPATASFSSPCPQSGVTGDVTVHATWPVAHCAQPGRRAIPFDAAMALEWAALKAACIARVDAGATGPCVAIAAAPALVTTLDGTWVLDGGACWWQADGGINPPDPTDNYAGITP